MFIREGVGGCLVVGSAVAGISLMEMTMGCVCGEGGLVKVLEGETG